MPRRFVSGLMLTALLAFQLPVHADAPAPEKNSVQMFPSPGSRQVNPDTRLILTFNGTPMLGTQGLIRVYEADSDSLVDMLDMGIPPGPRNTRTPAPYDALKYASVPDSLYTVKFPDLDTSHVYQKNYIGGTTEVDAFHFYPVLIEDSTATITLHNHVLDYATSYYVLIDPGVLALPDGSFEGIKSSDVWTFTTKAQPPSAHATTLVVSADGTGDFNTVQGAIDFLPEKNEKRKTIYIRNGVYEEMVYFRDKENVTFLGESRNGVQIRYANNGVFNTKLMSPDPELSRGVHNIRSVFAFDNGKGIHLVNFTLTSVGEAPAQAEALLAKGEEIILSHINIDGSGDALQATGTLYVDSCRIQGFGDNVLGYGAIYFHRCDFVSTYGPHLWVRNTQANHGNVLVECTLRTIGDVETTIARAPNSNGKTYPYVEAVLINCRLEGVRPEGWGKTADVTDDLRYWEFNSTNLTDGEPVDTTERHPASRQLLMPRDAAIIQSYLDPEFVLGGWRPEMQARILAQPASVVAGAGDSVELRAVVAASPYAEYQWYKYGTQVSDAKAPVLNIQTVRAEDEGEYVLTVRWSEGSIASDAVSISVQ